jgi:hypothetical protein
MKALIQVIRKIAVVMVKVMGTKALHARNPLCMKELVGCHGGNRSLAHPSLGRLVWKCGEQETL